MRGLLLKAAERITERGCAEVNKLGCALDRVAHPDRRPALLTGALGTVREREATRRVRIPRVS